MMFWCYDDKQSSWGKMLYMDALRSGHEAEFFKGSRHITEPGYLFARMEQRNVEAQRADLLVALDIPGIVGLTNREDILEYEDKLYQTEKYSGLMDEWMPKTFIIRSIEDARVAVDELGYPIVSKSRTGSGSASVRLHSDSKAAMDEAKIVFGRGLNTAREIQKGYLIWQKFLPNDYAYRVTRVGNWYWMIRIHNRDNAPFASGSGKMETIVPETCEELSVLARAIKFFEYSKSKWSGIDLLYDRDLDEWRVIETTLAWNLHNRGGNTDCPVFDKNGTLTTAGWIGAHQFLILLHEVEQGVFDG